MVEEFSVEEDKNRGGCISIESTKFYDPNNSSYVRLVVKTAGYVYKVALRRLYCDGS